MGVQQAPPTPLLFCNHDLRRPADPHHRRAPGLSVGQKTRPPRGLLSPGEQGPPARQAEAQALQALQASLPLRLSGRGGRGSRG